MDEKEKGEPPDAIDGPNDNRPKGKNHGTPDSFTDIEKKIIKRLGISLGHCDDFTHSSIIKYKSGKIVRSGTCVSNVDPDWGTYDHDYYEIVYESFEDFIKKNS